MVPVIDAGANRATNVPADARPRTVVLTIDTESRGERRHGVKLQIDGQVMLSPAQVTGTPGTKVVVTVVDKSYRQTTQTLTVPLEEGALTIKLSRRGSKRPPPDAKHKPEEDPVLRGRIEETEG